jgi:hypothetical protein
MSKTDRRIARPKPTPALLQEAPLRGLIAAQVPTGIKAVGRTGHFVVEISLGDGLALLANAHDQVRTFAALSTLAGFLARLGCHRFEVDTAAFEPGRVRAPQPERSACWRRPKTEPLLPVVPTQN